MHPRAQDAPVPILIRVRALSTVLADFLSVEGERKKERKKCWLFLRRSALGSACALVLLSFERSNVRTSGLDRLIVVSSYNKRDVIGHH